MGVKSKVGLKLGETLREFHEKKIEATPLLERKYQTS